MSCCCEDDADQSNKTSCWFERESGLFQNRLVGSCFAGRWLKATRLVVVQRLAAPSLTLPEPRQFSDPVSATPAGSIGFKSPKSTPCGSCLSRLSDSPFLKFSFLKFANPP